VSPLPMRLSLNVIPAQARHRRHNSSASGASGASGAVSSALHDAEINRPRSNGFTILMRHRA
jgi:hypothetical protein